MIATSAYDRPRSAPATKRVNRAPIINLEQRVADLFEAHDVPLDRTQPNADGARESGGGSAVGTQPQLAKGMFGGPAGLMGKVRACACARCSVCCTEPRPPIGAHIGCTNCLAGVVMLWVFIRMRMAASTPLLRT